MAKHHRSFSVKKRGQRPDDEKVTFELNDRTYKCKDEVQGALILDFVSAADSGGAAAASKILPFIRASLDGQEELDAFNELLESDDVFVEMETLGEIVGFLIEEYSDQRPTKASS